MMNATLSPETAPSQKKRSGLEYVARTFVVLIAIALGLIAAAFIGLFTGWIEIGC